MNNREFVQLSHSLKISEFTMFSLGNWFVSEKLDGIRGIWLPDTKGVQVSRLPFANLDRDRAGAGQRTATGLWSRYAKPIWCPPWFTENFPKDIALDGELWTGRNQFQRLCSIVKTKHPGSEWTAVRYRVFDSPSFDMVYADGKIHNGQLKKNFRGVYDWCKKELGFNYVPHSNLFDTTWHRVLKPLESLVDQYLIVHPQEQLNWKHSEAVDRLRKLLSEVLLDGGEGLIVRSFNSQWNPVRSKLCLKIKPNNEAEATVVGYTPGVGRLEGMVGSLMCEGELNGQPVAFGLSGMSDDERAIDHVTGASVTFPVGTMVSYLYRDVSSDGIPKEARFLRIRSDLE